MLPNGPAAPLAVDSPEEIATSPPQAGGRRFRIRTWRRIDRGLVGIGKMPSRKIRIHRTNIDLDGVAGREGRTVTKWTAVAMCGLLLVCAEIREAAARGGYSNFGPWADHSQALPLDTRAPRPNEGGVAKTPPLPAATHKRRMVHHR
jgi:hypothetical protein